MEKIKQVIVMRKDLNMRKGKMVAQGAHAALKIFLDRIHKSEDYRDEEEAKNKSTYLIQLNKEMLCWMDNYYTKICVSVNSESELLEIYEKAKASNLHTSLIQDAAFTEFQKREYTCCSIGPDYSNKIDKITGKLPLL